ncbi:MAG TPA: DHA2 family efflux MFS transporter permease subunit [Candidatus Limnocylindria bacterium]|nr:DHA2 family efflux MFS transporter permease subunit [Candidatus Limnocylindria bacterium]
MSNGSRNRWFGLVMLSLGLAMIIADVSIVNVAIPVMIEDLKIDFTTAEWVNTSYSLVFAALLVTLGRLGDVIGRRRLYLGGLIVFALASLGAGLAPNGTLLVGARLLQGIGGAAISPATLSIVSSEFRGRDRGIAFGIWGSVIGGMAAIGPLIGGWLTTNASWRWAFLINIPIGVVAFVGTLIYINDSRDENAERRFDLVGAVLTMVGFGALVFGLIEGYKYGWWGQSQEFSVLGLAWPAGWPVSIIPFAFALSALALVAFTVRELRKEARGDRSGVFGFRLFRYPGYRYGNLTALVLSLGEFGLLFVIPLFLQGMLGLSAFDTGLTLLPLALGTFVAGPSAGALAARIGPKWVVTSGMGLEAIAIFWIGLLFSPDLDVWSLVPPLAVYGVGVGLATAQLTNVALAQIPREESGVASGGTSTLRQVGSALGIAILGTTLAIGLGQGTRDRLQAAVDRLPPQAAQALPFPASELPELVAKPIESTFGQALPGLLSDPRLPEPARPVIRSAVEESFVDGAVNASRAATGFVLLGLIISLFIPNTRHEADHDPA